MSYDTATPYIASYVLVEKDGKICFVLRSNTAWMNGYYGLPSGKVEKTESYHKCAVREVKEEIGLEISENQLEFLHAMQRLQPEEENSEWIDIFFRVKKWEGKPYNAEPHKHSDVVWLDLKDLPDNVIPYTKFALENIQKAEKYSEYGFN